MGSLPSTHQHSHYICISLTISKGWLDVDMALLSLDELKEAQKVVERSSLGVRRTPCILVRGDQACEILPDMEHVGGWSRVYFKLENLQSTGSFKIRGVANQFERVKAELGKEGRLVTMSAGNYGRSYAEAARALGLIATVLLPNTAPASRETLLKHAGVSVERLESRYLMSGVERH